MRRALVGFSALLLAGCPPDLSGYTIVDDNPPVDGGGGGQPNPLDLGPPCPSPHLLIGTTQGNAARVMRWDPATQAFCRTSPLIEMQGAFGSTIDDATVTRSREVLELDVALLGLDAQGFPAWRYQAFETSQFSPYVTEAVQTPQGERLAVLWGLPNASQASGILLLDDQGAPQGEVTTIPFSAQLIAAHPDGSAAILMTGQYGPVRSYPISDSTTSIATADGSDLFNIDGRFNSIESDPATHRLLISGANGVASWTVGTPFPTTWMSCASYCSSFVDATVDPDTSDGVYAVCDSDSTRHLVHLTPSSCAIVVDGTTLGSRQLSAVVLVRLPI